MEDAASLKLLKKGEFPQRPSLTSESRERSGAG